MLNGAWRCPIAIVPSGTRAPAPPPGSVRIWVSGEGFDRWKRHMTSIASSGSPVRKSPVQ